VEDFALFYLGSSSSFPFFGDTATHLSDNILIVKQCTIAFQNGFFPFPGEKNKGILLQYFL
jgi:hypothetical protein